MNRRDAENTEQRYSVQGQTLFLSTLRTYGILQQIGGFYIHKYLANGRKRGYNHQGIFSMLI